MFVFNFSCVIFIVFVKFLKEMMQDTRTEKKVGKSVSQTGVKFSHLLAKFCTNANFSHQCEFFAQIFALNISPILFRP